MNTLKEFNEYIKQGIVKKQAKDNSRAENLIKESERRFISLKVYLKKIELNDENANDVIENCYNIIIGFIRSKMLLQGFNSSGTGAHEAEISYLRELNFSETEISFANQLRYFRNGIMYYGKQFDKEYANKVMNFLFNFYPKIKKCLKI
jgi:hypothetical protein